MSLHKAVMKNNVKAVEEAIKRCVLRGMLESPLTFLSVLRVCVDVRAEATTLTALTRCSAPRCILLCSDRCVLMRLLLCSRSMIHLAQASLEVVEALLAHPKIDPNCRDIRCNE